MKLLVIFGVLTYSIVANGQTICENATVDFQTDNPSCYQSYVEILAIGAANNELTEHLCENETCITALMNYTDYCRSNETVSEVDEELK